jgi:hypothetical protein
LGGDDWLSLAIVEVSAPAIPIGVLSVAWDKSLDGAEAMCCDFADASQLALVTGIMRLREIQLACFEACAGEDVDIDESGKQMGTDDELANGTKLVYA